MKSLDKACSLLRILAAQPRARGRDLARMLGMPISTAHRILRALEAAGLVQQVGERGAYELGPFIRSLASGYPERQRLVEVARPHMVHLRDKCDETVALNILEAGSRVVVDQVESTQELRRTITNLGSPMPLHAGAASKLLLAQLDDRELARHLRRRQLPRLMPNTPTDPRRLLAEIRRIRRQGFAVSFEEIVPGVASIAMPIREADGRVTAAVAVSGPTARLRPALMRRIRPVLRETVEEISRELLSARS